MDRCWLSVDGKWPAIVATFIDMPREEEERFSQSAVSGEGTRKEGGRKEQQQSLQMDKLKFSLNMRKLWEKL